MKPTLKGNLEELYEARAVKVRSLKSGRFVEFVKKYDNRILWNGQENPNGRVWYEIGICGINANNVPCAAYFNPEKDEAYFWQYADKNAVREILESPVKAYDWRDVKNGIKQ